MLFWALLFLVLVIAVLQPLAQRQRERKLAEQLKKTRNPIEAMIVVDTAIEQSRREGGFMATLRESYRFWLR